MKRFLQWLKCHVIDPLIVEPLRIQITAFTSALTHYLDDIMNTLDEIKAALVVDKRSKRLPLILVQDLSTGLTLKGDIRFMQMRKDQKVRIEFGAPVDKNGDPAKVQEGSVSISVTDGSATVEPDPTNPFAATIIGAAETVDPTEPGAVVIVADADLGDGVKNIQGVEPLLITGLEAVGFGPATVGTPEDQ